MYNSADSRRRAVVWFAVLASGVVALVSAPSTVRAHGSPDQIHIPPGWPTRTGHHAICSANRITVTEAAMGQWLTPSRPSLVAVDLFLLAEWFRSSHELRLNVRENGPDGPLLASTTKEIRGPLLPSHRLLTHFDLESPLQVVAGKPLFVELINPLELTGSPDVHRQGAVTWSFAPTDAYQRGDSLWCYFPGFRPPGVPGEDFHFITYSEGDGSDHVCPQIKDRVPELAILRALAEPTNVSGYNELERPGVYPGPYNRLRTWLSIQRLSTPFHPVANRLVYRAGCP